MLATRALDDACQGNLAGSGGGIALFAALIEFVAEQSKYKTIYLYFLHNTALCAVTFSVEIKMVILTHNFILSAIA